MENKTTTTSMGRILRLLFQDPEILLGFLVLLPHIVSIVLTVLIAIAIWNKRLTKSRGIILFGAVISMLSVIIGHLVNYIVIPNYGVEAYTDYIYYIQANYFIGSLGGLLFSWGLYRYFLNTDTKTVGSNEDAIDLFITRNS